MSVIRNCLFLNQIQRRHLPYILEPEARRQTEGRFSIVIVARTLGPRNNRASPDRGILPPALTSMTQSGAEEAVNFSDGTISSSGSAGGRHTGARHEEKDEQTSSPRRAT